MKDNIHSISKANQDFIDKLQLNPKVKNARSKGVIMAFELDVKMERYGNLRNELFKFFMDRGMFLRPLGNTIYIVPPYTISSEELQKLYSVIEDSLSEF